MGKDTQKKPDSQHETIGFFSSILIKLYPSLKLLNPEYVCTKCRYSTSPFMKWAQLFVNRSIKVTSRIFQSPSQIRSKAFPIVVPHSSSNHQPSDTHSIEYRRMAEEPLSTTEHRNMAIQTIANMATAVWRAKIKLEKESQVELPIELRNLPRHILAAWDALAAGQVHVDDLIGKRYVPGMAVNVLTFQPLEGIGSELIHETIKPMIYLHDRLIQRADIIVARPLRESDIQPEKDSCESRELSERDPSKTDIRFPDSKGTKADGPNYD